MVVSGVPSDGVRLTFRFGRGPRVPKTPVHRIYVERGVPVSRSVTAAHASPRGALVRPMV
jgi:hypothetical protein